MDSSLWVVTINWYVPLHVSRGVRLYFTAKMYSSLSEDLFNLCYSVDPDEMPHYAVLYLSLYHL